ncbi:MAG: DNA-binding domain-containing protein [Bauldia sp.]
MRPLGEVQAAFAAALRNPAIGPPAGVVGPDAGPAPRRFAVYRNNVSVSLANALASAFPVVGRIVGAEFFQAMARTYVVAEPPRSPVLLDYGATFADFIASFAPAASLPYLADVARIERAWREAYHAADAVPLGPADFARIGEAEIPRLTLKLHPSARILRSPYPARTIWTMNAIDGVIEPVDLSLAEDSLIGRPEAEVEVRAVPPGGADFIDALFAGAPLGQSAAAGLAAAREFDIAANLAGLIGAGLVIDLSIAEGGALQ